ncbi:MAG: O-acetyl-ADP-ribose deacetylase [Chitinophagaceae bacterium]
MAEHSIEVIQGDITKIAADAIVNAANSSLLGGGGVDGAIHRAGGPSILEECRKIVAKQGDCKTGEAVITTAGNLPAKFVIHTVGPVWDESRKEKMDQLLSNCYRNSLQLAVENNCGSVAFPNISTGVYRFPKDCAAKVSVAAVKNFLQQHSTIERVIFVCYDDENLELVRSALTNGN